MADIGGKLKDLARQMETHRDGLVVEQREACCRLQALAEECWSSRPLPPACRSLQLLMLSSATELQASVEVVRPNAGSATVAMVVCAGRAEAVVKCRGENAQKAAREECHYLTAEALGLSSVAAPCVAWRVRLGTLEASGDAHTVEALLSQQVKAVLEAAEGCCPASMWVSVEKCIHVSPDSHSLRGLSSRLGNKFGCVDLMQAYFSSPDGQRIGGVPLLRDGSSKQNVSDADICCLVRSLDVVSVQKLCLLACVVLQRDGGPPNLMIAEQPEYLESMAQWQSVGEGPFRLVSIDATRILGTCAVDGLRLTDESDDNGYAAYWYPACIALPQAAEVLDQKLAEEILGVDPLSVEQTLIAALESAPGAPSGREEASGPAKRLDRLQEVLRSADRGTITARECCFRVVPSWCQDASRADLGPLPMLAAHIRAGGSSEAWARRCWVRRQTPAAISLCAVAELAELVAVRLRPWRGM
eukprot:TRINITY_DN72581_c0_g1_i1.p1 TRINITY_DN72581_c0_g1~~TRINITY_DN72581_c0_g1_i1.p1  ORF type:complete len:484 (+),score=76.97 TRINITY_DN72581_c0_g1_i1:35-1453(+)